MAVSPVLLPVAHAREGVDNQRAASILRLHLKLARQPGAYVEISPEAVIACVRGMQVKRLPVRSSTSLYSGAPRISTVLAKTPAVPVREVVVRVDKISDKPSENPADPSATVSSADEIISVDDMPNSYSIELADGSFLWVFGESSGGLIAARRKEWLQFKISCRFLFRRALGRPVRITLLEMDSASARHLFWLLRPEMSVIY